MCGICGIYNPEFTDQLSDTVRRMNERLVHRGPDGAGQFTAGPLSIAMRRLAIIDVAGGQQPIVNEDGQLHVVFNGEIYNYAQLREQLLATGRHQFRTQSDTEVLLHLYEEHGPTMLEHLRGMFAFCIYDQRDDSLFLARDRFGEKPLFYAQLGRAFGFSSEPASLLQWPVVPRRLDTESLLYLLLYGFVPAPRTAFADVQQLPAGHWARWKNGQLEIRRYFELQFKPQSKFDDLPTAVEAVREALLCCVKRQMVSEVPLGAFLSGGIDSSSIVAAMQRQSSRPIKTFTVRFEHTPYDESPVARRVAKHLGTEHHEFVVTNEAFVPEDLWRIVRHVGQPFGDTSAIPTYFICKQIRDHVTVCLSGDGGDEIFAGYNYFIWSQQIDRLAARVPRSLLGVGESLSAAAARLPGFTGIGLLRQARRALHVAALAPNQRAWAMDSLFEPTDLPELIDGPLADAWPRTFSNMAANRAEPSDGLSRLRKLMKHRIEFLLPEDMLAKIDRMSMANSLEVRAPMLGYDLAIVAAQMPDRMLIDGRTTKYVLREAVRPWLPEEVFTHPKMGFSIPMHMFQNQGYRDLCHDLLLSDRPGIVQTLFHRPAIARIVERGLNQKRDGANFSVYRGTHQLWLLLQLAAWEQEFKVSL